MTATTATLGLDRVAGRCPHGFAPQHHPTFCGCDLGEWFIFTTALREVAAEHGGLVHQSAMRARIRGRIAPKHIGGFYRRARTEGLIEDTGDREQSDDAAGRNTDKLDRIYALAGAA